MVIQMNHSSSLIDQGYDHLIHSHLDPNPLLNSSGNDNFITIRDTEST
ncbi:hypothetical protein PU629_20905 [Pullulanibacillus sp. KACC 23026]|nr:hypothetical protein [Pullulanibacillus sp. KACC 23026]WEG12516.1 hypothetical protein PU629_20905 [Pullulanibacillus sp. KACC 23026]